MDTQITNWELSLEEQAFQEVKEGISTDPLEPYHPQYDTINWN